MVARDLQQSSCSIHLLKQSHLEQLFQNNNRQLLNISKDENISSMSLGNLCQCSASLRVKMCFLNGQKIPPVFQIVPTAFGPVSEWKSAWLFVLPLQVFIYIDTCIPCVLYTHIYAQSQLSQPFLMGEMLQSLNLVALCWTLLSLQGSPELDISLHCGLTSGEQRGRILLFLAASALPNAAQGLFGHLYGKVTLLVYVWCGVY